jgi:hypothetical protein
MTAFNRVLFLSAIFFAGCVSAPPLAVTPCKTYCASYDEGYQWAQKANLSDDRSCEGYAKDFVRGCQQEVTDLQKSFAPRDGF